jgi:hypothetical protein
LIKSKKATPLWSKGIFCIRLNVEQSNNFLEPVVVGIDPGSKKEALTIKSESHTYLNIQADAVTWVKDAVKTRREMRRTRRYRKTPCRKPRFNLFVFLTVDCQKNKTSKKRWHSTIHKGKMAVEAEDNKVAF